MITFWQFHGYTKEEMIKFCEDNIRSPSTTPILDDSVKITADDYPGLLIIHFTKVEKK